MLEDSVVAFIDLLGFKEAIEHSDNASAIISLLDKFIFQRRDFSLLPQNQQEGQESYRLEPAVSTFSDHIVISYPTKPIKDKLTTLTVIIGELQRYITWFAIEAMKLNFLIRGGITLGKLYHRGGLVVGEALHRAYEIESKFANFPRVIVSPEVVEELYPAPPEKLTDEKNNKDLISPIFEDIDGMFCLNYLPNMLWYNLRQGHIAVKTWMDEVDTIINNNIKELKINLKRSAIDTQKNIGKWLWFQRHFNLQKTYIIETINIALPERLAQDLT